MKTMIHRYRFIQFVCLSLFVCVSGCATIIKGELQPVNFKSSPQGANITIKDLRTGDDVSTGTTPHISTLKKGNGYFKKGLYKATIEKKGYESQEVLIEGTANGWYIGGNLLFGGLIGWLIVDPLTGAMWNLEPDIVDIRLHEKVYKDPYFLSAEDFTEALTIQKLCESIMNDNYDISFSSQDNTIDRINEIISLPTFFTKLADKGKLPRDTSGKVSVSKDLEELLKKTEPYRLDYTKFSSLTDGQKENIKKLNRRLLEMVYPLHTPREGLHA